MHRFFVPPGWLGKDCVQFEGEIARQLKQVIRIKVGEKVVLLDGTGDEYEVEIDGTDTSITGRVLSVRKNDAEPLVGLTLFFGFTQREKMEWVLQKGTEVGVTRFIPVVTSRSLVQDPGSSRGKIDRWKSICREAAEQSGRGKIPAVEEAISFLQCVESLGKFDLGLIAWEGEHHIILNQVLSSRKPRTMGLLIGPEGGFSEAEHQTAVQQGWVSFSLGKRILRMETAALVASALILSHFEDRG